MSTRYGIRRHPVTGKRYAVAILDGVITRTARLRGIDPADTEDFEELLYRHAEEVTENPWPTKRSKRDASLAAETAYDAASADYLAAETAYDAASAARDAARIAYTDALRAVCIARATT